MPVPGYARPLKLNDPVEVYPDEPTPGAEKVSWRSWPRERIHRLTLDALCINVTARYYTITKIRTLKRKPDPDLKTASASMQALARSLAALSRPEDVRAFLQDLCTPAELEAMADRWRVVPLLLKGVPYREIHELTQVSVTTIGRVARTLETGSGGYAIAAESQKTRTSNASH